MREWDEIAEHIFSRITEPITSHADAERIVRQLLPGQDYQVTNGVTEALWRLSLRQYFPSRGKEGVVWVSL